MAETYAGRKSSQVPPFPFIDVMYRHCPRL
jgi:hypothetical protein